MGFSCVSVEKNPLANVGDTHLINHSGILAWEIPVGQDLVTRQQLTIAGVRSVSIKPFGKEARSLVKQDFEPLTRVPAYMMGS